MSLFAGQREIQQEVDGRTGASAVPIIYEAVKETASRLRSSTQTPADMALVAECAGNETLLWMLHDLCPQLDPDQTSDVVSPGVLQAQRTLHDAGVNPEPHPPGSKKRPLELDDDAAEVPVKTEPVVKQETGLPVAQQHRPQKRIRPTQPLPGPARPPPDLSKLYATDTEGQRVELRIGQGMSWIDLGRTVRVAEGTVQSTEALQAMYARIIGRFNIWKDHRVHSPLIADGSLGLTVNDLEGAHGITTDHPLAGQFLKWSRLRFRKGGIISQAEEALIQSAKAQVLKDARGEDEGETEEDGEEEAIIDPSPQARRGVRERRAAKTARRRLRLNADIPGYTTYTSNKEAVDPLGVPCPWQPVTGCLTVVNRNRMAFHCAKDHLDETTGVECRLKCGKWFPSLALAELHHLEPKPKSPMYCVIAGESSKRECRFPNCTRVSTISRVHHKEHEAAGDGLACAGCDRRLADAYELAYHQSYACASAPPPLCSVCSLVPATHGGESVRGYSVHGIRRACEKCHTSAKTTSLQRLGIDPAGDEREPKGSLSDSVGTEGADHFAGKGKKKKALGPPRYWTEEEDQFIKDLDQGITRQAMADAHHLRFGGQKRSHKSVSSRLDFLRRRAEEKSDPDGIEKSDLDGNESDSDGTKSVDASVKIKKAGILPRPWTHEEDLFIIDMYRTTQLSQAILDAHHAKFGGEKRSMESVKSRMQRLRGWERSAADRKKGAAEGA